MDGRKTMTNENWHTRIEEAWAYREETLYPKLFGSLGAGIYPLGGELFTSVFHQNSYDPRWLSYGVFECAPTAQRLNWLYVSSGLSNPWEATSPNPDATSGLGCEFILQCPAQARWAIILLQRMVAFQILLGANRFPGKGLLKEGDRIPLRSPINGTDSPLTSVMVGPARDFDDIQQLPSGRFRFMQFIGITEDEADFARVEGSPKLLQHLLERKAAPVTNPDRKSIEPSR
jgi:Suppressor of fused protein (SUFU)